MATASDPPKAPHRSLHVLLVEDDAQLRDYLSVRLKRLGHHVRDVPDGRAALEACRKDGRPDVVVTDIFMPEADGLELIRSITREFGAVAMVAMSGGSPRVPADYLPHAKMFGAAETLAKPFTTEQLVEAIDRAVTRQEVADEGA